MQVIDSSSQQTVSILSRARCWEQPVSGQHYIWAEGVSISPALGARTETAKKSGVQMGVSILSREVLGATLMHTLSLGSGCVSILSQLGAGSNDTGIWIAHMQTSFNPSRPGAGATAHADQKYATYRFNPLIRCWEQLSNRYTLRSITEFQSSPS